MRTVFPRCSFIPPTRPYRSTVVSIARISACSSQFSGPCSESAHLYTPLANAGGAYGESR